MDANSIAELATAVWPPVTTEAGEALGAAGTEEALRLLSRVRSNRTERGEDPDPASEAELRAELALLPADELRPALNVVVIHFHGKVDASGANFGIQVDRN